jgi:hypothetical protein
MLALPSLSQADEVPAEISTPTMKPDWLVLPFVFSSQRTGFSAGLAGIHSGTPHPESVLGAALFGSTESAWGVLATGRNLRVPLLESGRLYSDIDMSLGHYPNQRVFFAFRTPVGQPRPGSNKSSDSQYFKGSGWDNLITLDFKYAMPWGRARDTSMGMFLPAVVADGTASADSEGLNPLENGRTWLGVRLARRSLGFDPAPPGAQDNSMATTNLQLFMRHDGTDHPLDPTRGFKWRVSVRNDPGWADSLNSWTDMQLDLTTHIPLGENSWSRQQVLALNVWSTYSPTYEYKVSAGQVTTSHAPPFISGTSLGGFFRMRAYPSYRFHDKAGIYYSGEYRSTLRWNPFTDIDLLKPLEIRWVQLVGFAELGNVAQDMGISALHRDMLYDVGVGLRMSVKGIVARIDYAVAPHNSGVWFMLGHAF